jgi:hypothetical protein
MELDTLTARLIYMNRTGAGYLARRTPPIREVPEQQTDYFAALKYVLTDEPEGLKVRPTQLPVAKQLGDDFPGLGGVDLTVEREEQPVALIELKLGKDKLWNSVWDLCKLVLALRHGVGKRAFMVGGAPIEAWENEKQGPDLFEDADYKTADVLARYSNCFRLWPTAPQRLPADIRVETLDVSPCAVADFKYEIRLVEVLDNGSDWLEISDAMRLTSERRGLQ